MKTFLILIVTSLAFPLSAHAMKVTVRYTVSSPAFHAESHIVQSPTLSGVHVDNWDDIKMLGVHLARKYGIAPSVIAGMTALESGHGTSEFCQERHNCWGIGAYDANPNLAFSFTSYEAGYKALISLLQGPRYARAWANRRDPYKMIEEIKQAGYASSPTYVQKITNLPEFTDYLE